MFFSHADFTEYAEAHGLRVLTLRDVCATKFSGWLREIRVVCVKFCSHTDFTELTEAHWLRVLAMRDIGAMICTIECRGRTLCRPVVNLRTISPICVGTLYNLRTIASICVGTSYNLRTITPIRIYVKYKFYIHNIGAPSHGLKGQ